MSPLEREFRRLASFHGDMLEEGGWLSIDLTRRPDLGRGGTAWSDYITLLLSLVGAARSPWQGLKLEYNRFLRLRIREGR